jgi:hypothetical protein
VSDDEAAALLKVLFKNVVATSAGQMMPLLALESIAVDWCN